MKDLPTKIKYVITKIKILGCGAGPLGPTWVSPLEKRLVYKSMRKPEELPLLAAGGQTEKERRKKKKNGKEGANYKHFFQPTLPHVFFPNTYKPFIFFTHPSLSFILVIHRERKEK